MFENKRITPLIIGVPGATLSAGDEALIRRLNPAGFILFARNCIDAAQVQALCTRLKALSPFQPPLIFIDQEGGRVARIRWDHFYVPPAASVFGEIYRENPGKALMLTRLSAYVSATQLKKLGITGVCAPVADVRQANAHDIIGDRAFSETPDDVAKLTASSISGFLAGGIWPMMKHAPGHGRAMADSHESLPQVETSVEELNATDFLPFKENAACPFTMTAHVLFNKIDKNNCATHSEKTISFMRKELGIDGLIVADDLNMQALKGDIKTRAAAALKAGCDLLLHCSGRLDGTADPEHFASLESLTDLPPLSPEANARIQLLPKLVEKIEDETVEESLAILHDELAPFLKPTHKKNIAHG